MTVSPSSEHLAGTHRLPLVEHLLFRKGFRSDLTVPVAHFTGEATEAESSRRACPGLPG